MVWKHLSGIVLKYDQLSEGDVQGLLYEILTRMNRQLPLYMGMDKIISLRFALVGESDLVAMEWQESTGQYLQGITGKAISFRCFHQADIAGALLLAGGWQYNFEDPETGLAEVRTFDNIVQVWQQSGGLPAQFSHVKVIYPQFNAVLEPKGSNDD